MTSRGTVSPIDVDMGSPCRIQLENRIDPDFLNAPPTDVQLEITQELPAHTQRDTIDHKDLWELPVDARREILELDLPSGWEIREWPGLASVSYVHRDRQIKTWKRPTAEDDYTPFPTVADRLRYFDPNTQPPLPLDFRVSKGTKLAQDDEPISETRGTFQYPLEVYLVHTPIRGLRPIYRAIDTAYNAFFGMLDIPHLVNGFFGRHASWVLPITLLTLGLVVYCLCYLVIMFILSLPLFWRLWTSLFFISILTFPFTRLLSTLTKPVVDMYMLTTVAGTGMLGLNTLVALGRDQAAWSHWKVLVGPYMYELTKVRKALQVNGNQDAEMEEDQIVNHDNIIEEVLDESLPLLNYPSLTALRTEFPATTFTSSSPVEAPPLDFAETSSPPVHIVAETLIQQPTSKWSGDICQCVKRHLTEAEYEYYKSTYNTVLIGETVMLEDGMDETATTLIKSWPAYRTFDTNCQAFTLNFLDVLCDSNLSAVSTRMVLHFSWFIHIPNLVNIILGVLISFAPTYGGEGEIGNVERWARPCFAIIAFFMTYACGWTVFQNLLGPRFGVSLESRIQKYYTRAARRYPEYHALQTEKALFVFMFLVYAFIHMGIFVMLTYGYLIEMITPFVLNEVLISRVMKFLIGYASGIEPPCDRLSIGGTFDFTSRSTMHIIKLAVAAVAVFFVWPIILYQRMSGEPSWFDFSWITDVFSNWADLGEFNDKHEQLMELAYRYNITVLPTAFKAAARNGSLSQVPRAAFKVLQHSNFTEFVSPAICLVFGVGNGTGSGLDGEL
ncbi:uncharacterized protein GGS22DRAFT_98062 [Annulohypoxylon maeteangense]|uniref:uncharacterized protein n=1 Tax=Annulohypoxylon maeteangense TaxID=1927788 RepID=UPI002008634E|nr:uncharacterized protein GGS22DRAFT_98062 [Annulohypoxylon maeteangense]KAI0888503.1 hypothetical protein GGS22DRAFT_98062 [Annulohypoxylon maeteangense]